MVFVYIYILYIDVYIYMFLYIYIYIYIYYSGVSKCSNSDLGAFIHMKMDAEHNEHNPTIPFHLSQEDCDIHITHTSKLMR